SGANYNRVDRALLESPGGFPAGSPTSWSANIQLEQTLYSGGAVQSGVRAARASQEAAAADFESEVQQALLSVREAYYSVLLARQQVEVQEQAVQLLQEELTNAEARVRAGSGSPFDQLRAEVALANGQPPLIRARNSYRLAAVELLRLIGVPAVEGAEERVAGELAFSTGEVDLPDLLEAARERGAVVRAVEKQCE